MAESQLVIGVDFDNTIATFDGLIHQIALEQGLIHSNTPKSKMRIRDAIRLLPGGEIEWQKLQGAIYGPRMNEALLAEGFRDFVKTCARHGDPVHIISHKTEYANYDDTHSNLHTAALSWMEAHGFFRTDGLGLSQQQVYLEPSRSKKLGRIEQLGCTHFIDDLDITFREDSFPHGVEKILYSSIMPSPSLPGVKVIATWQAISDYILGSKR